MFPTSYFPNRYFGNFFAHELVFFPRESAYNIKDRVHSAGTYFAEMRSFKYQRGQVVTHPSRGPVKILAVIVSVDFKSLDPITYFVLDKWGDGFRCSSLELE